MNDLAHDLRAAEDALHAARLDLRRAQDAYEVAQKRWREADRAFLKEKLTSELKDKP